MIIELVRDFRDDTCTLGIMTVNGKRWHTMERPWVPSTKGGVGGEKGVSCVPPGRYKLVRHSSEAYSNVFALAASTLDVYHWPWEVPKSKREAARTAVLIHAANYASELRGCIAPGKERKKTGSEWGVFRSRDAVNELRTVVAGIFDLELWISEDTLT